MTEALLFLFAVLLMVYVALPMIFSNQADPLPDAHDPVLQDLEEERDALFQAILELETREDLPRGRRDALRAHYEAKAALVLRALDTREQDPDSALPSHQTAVKHRPPVMLLILLVIVTASAASLSSFVLPRVGNSSITSFFKDDLDAGRALQQLQKAVNRQPSRENLLALADAYWQLGEAAEAEKTYQRIVNGSLPVSALAYRRLGYLTLQTDLEAATNLLELSRAAEPAALDTLFALGELYYTLGRLAKARQVWQEFLVQSGGEGDSEVSARLEGLLEVEPLYAAVLEDPSEVNRLALAGALWDQDKTLLATEFYFLILAESNPNHPVALRRAGQQLFLSGRVQEATVLLERLRAIGETDVDSLLMLGHSYFNLQRHAEAIEAWETYLTMAVEPGPVPDLIASAQARLGTLLVSGEQLYAAHCATCHGSVGQGGSGTTQADNPNAERRGNVQDVVRFGRGLMPGFGLKLSDSDLERLVGYVVNKVAKGIALTP